MTTDLAPSFSEQARLRCRAGEAENRARAAGRQLAKLRRNAMLTPRQLEFIVGLPPGQVTNWESGREILTEAAAKRIIDRVVSYCRLLE
jgi:DNA-binding transcriptional regulator YiaG